MARSVSILALLAMSAFTLAQAQAPPPMVQSMDELFGLEPLLTTSLSDAVTGVPFLDDFDPQGAGRLTLLPRGPSDGYLLVRSGLFQQRLQSYCLHQGKYGPGEGDGFLYAPLKGPHADILRGALRRAAAHPEVSQSDVQDLLWDVLAGVGMGLLPEDPAAQLLTAEQLSDLKALGERRRQKVEERMPEMMERMRALQQSEVGRRMAELGQRMSGFSERMRQAVASGDMAALQREAAAMQPLAEEMAQLQGQWLQELTGANLTFEERERASVLEGEHEPGEDSQEVPRGRWSYHPDGYFLRHFSSSYKRTRVQVYVARRFDIQRDDRGRLVRIADQYGNRIETDYDDAIPPASVAGDAGVQGHAFRSIRLVRRFVFAPDMMFDLEARWEGVGWTLAGIPSAEGRGGAGTGRFADLNERYRSAQTYKEQVETLAEEVAKLRRELGTAREGMAGAPGTPDGSLRDVMDLAHYSVGLLGAAPAGAGQEAWAAEHVALAKEAWAFALCQYTGGWVPEGPGGGLASGGAGARPGAGAPTGGEAGAPEYVPADGVAVPGDTSEQRLGLGPPQDKSDKQHDINAVKYEAEAAKAIRKAFQETHPEPGESVDDYRQRVGEKAAKDLQTQLKNKGIDQTPGKPYAPMGTHPTDLRLAPGGARDDPAYADDWKAYDNMGEGEFEQYIKDKYFGDDPDAVWEGARRHEQDHIDLGNEEVQRAKARGDANWQEAFGEWLDNPWLLRDAEMRAYDEQIKYLEDWIKHDC